MSLKLYDATNEDGLFNVLGKAFYALERLHSHCSNTSDAFPKELDDFLDQAKLLSGTPEVDRMLAGLPTTLANWRANNTGVANTIATRSQMFLRQLAAEETGEARVTLQRALEWLVEQMNSQGYYVSSANRSLSCTPNGGNAGPNPVTLYTFKRPDGTMEPYALPETCSLEAVGDYLQLTSDPQVGELAYNWPAGSGLRKAFRVLSPADGLIPNGDIETLESDRNWPQGWLLYDGTLGTHVRVALPEEQTVRIEGAPTGGCYYLCWNDGNQQHVTERLDYDAGGAAVQTALRAIPGLEEITVSTAGTSPNYTHTITFEGTPGNIAQLTSINQLTGDGDENIVHNTSQAGEANSFRGRSLVIVGQGETKPTIYVPLSVQAERVYAFSVACTVAYSQSGGQLRFALVRGVGGNITQDPAGNDNKAVLTIGVSGLQFLTNFWTLQEDDADSEAIYLRIDVPEAIPSGTTVHLDDFLLTPLEPLYAGGPRVAFARHRTPIVDGDKWTLTVSNDTSGGGKLQQWFGRVFQPYRFGLALPESGTSLIPDSVIG